MYRPSNERYAEGSQMSTMGNYPPISNIPKMHMLDSNYPPPMPPLYYDPSQPYDFAPQPQPQPQNTPNEPYDNRYANWRDPSEPKTPMMMNPPIPPPMHFDMRQPLHHEPYPPAPKAEGFQQQREGFQQQREGFQQQRQSFPQQRQGFQQGREGFQQQGGTPMPQVNVVQRISGIVKSQLSYLQSIMFYAERKTQEEKNKKERERSRSRSRDRPPRPPQRFHREWNCVKCAFLNFDFRDRCKRCNEPKPADSQQPRLERPDSGGRGYVPGPDDWRCNKCGNINYARRLQCHRCRTPRSKP